MVETGGAVTKVKLVTAQSMTTSKLYAWVATAPEKFEDIAVSVNEWVPKSPGVEINEAFTEMMFAERLMNAAVGVRFVAVNGQTIVG